jgi:hypothetical protein
MFRKNIKGDEKIKMELIYAILINLVLCFIAVTDIILTSISAKKFETFRKARDLGLKKEDIELNWFVKHLWNKIGIKNTKYVYIALVIVFYSVFSWFVYNYSNPFMLSYAMFFFGAYTIIIRIHISNLMFIKKENKLPKDINFETLTKLNNGNDGIPPKPKVLGILPNFI